MHIALIPDGNRRWAKEKGYSVAYGHKIGAQRIIDFIRWCSTIEDIKEVSVFILSTDNLVKRSASEIKHLKSLISKEAPRLVELFGKYYAINIYGDVEKIISKKVLENLREKISSYKDQKKTLNILIGYGGREEIIHATQEYCSSQDKDFRECLYVKNDVDLLIRTGKETRISNFLLFQIAYAEIFFVNKYWPEFNEEDFKDVLEKFKQKERRFGR